MSRNNKTYEPISIGVIGCGTIASALITGLVKTQDPVQENGGIPLITGIYLSERSEKKSSALQAAFPDLVCVYQDNQDVLDMSEVVFLCVLNNQTASVLEPLQFDPQRHTLVSMVATSKLDHLKELCGLDSDRVFKMICLPSIAKQEGCALVVPKTTAINPNTRDDHTSEGSKIATVLRFLDLCGGYVECETEEIMNLLITPTCFMGPLYGILRQNQQWLVQRGVPPADATYFVGRQYASMMSEAERGCQERTQHFEHLVQEQTPGGLNEQALSNLTKLGIYDAYDKAMDAVLSRLKGDSDGSLTQKTCEDEHS